MLINKSTGKKINVEVIKIDSLVKKMFGMIFFKEPNILLFKTRFGIHTFFLKKCIDVIILEKAKVVKVSENLCPNRLFFWNPKFSTVLEMPKGSIEKLEIKKGNIIKVDL